MKISKFTFLLVIAIAESQSALASKPVVRTMVGCVSNGVFTNERGYMIKVRQPSGALLDLTTWNGKRLRMNGKLLPGDNYYLMSPPIVVGPCR